MDASPRAGIKRTDEQRWPVCKCFTKKREPADLRLHDCDARPGERAAFGAEPPPRYRCPRPYLPLGIFVSSYNPRVPSSPRALAMTPIASVRAPQHGGAAFMFAISAMGICQRQQHYQQPTLRNSGINSAFKLRFHDMIAALLGISGVMRSQEGHPSNRPFTLHFAQTLP